MSSALSWQLAAVCGAGLFVGSFLHRCVRRLPLAKSVIWPLGEFCPKCLQPISMLCRLPLLGFMLALGRCRTCGREVGWRGPIIESLTAALIALLFFLYIGSRKPYATWAGQLGYDHSKLVALFVYHSLLVCFLIVATFIDLEYWIIPDSVTIPGMLVGVFLGTFWYVELHPLLVMRTPEQSPASLISETTWARLFGRSDSGLVYESIFSAINAHWNLNWNRWIGFMTGMTGLVAGGLLVWVVRAICSWAFQAEAIGFGDVTLMAMVGGFLGWQLVIVAFFLAPLSAVVVGLFGLVLAGWRAIPYGPHLSIGTLFTVLFLRELSPFIWAIERDTTFIIIAAVFMLVLLAIVAVTVQWCKRFLIRVR